MVEQVKGDRGASSVEYGLIAFAVAAVVVAAVVAFGDVLNASFTSSCDTILTTRNTYDSTEIASCGAG